VPRVLGRLVPRLRRLEVLRTGALPGRRSVAQHEAITDRAEAGDAAGAASAARENWLTLGALIERSLNAPAER
jgi:DNA-binding GntR family transcriptional regulator